MSKKHWGPTVIKDVIKCGIQSSTSPVVVGTDEGLGYFKALGNQYGPQVLACEFVGTSLARLLGIPTFDFCIIPYNGVPEIHLADGRLVESGPGFIAKEEQGQPWDGTKKMLKKISNTNDITRLVCVDTWTRNQDRYFQREDGEPRKNLDNVFLSFESKHRLTLKAMDFTHAFTNGGDVNAKITREAKDGQIYGLFPEFKGFLDKETACQLCNKLKTIKAKQIQPIIDQIPREWEIDAATRNAWVDYIVSRAGFLSTHFITMIGLQHMTIQNNFQFDEE